MLICDCGFLEKEERDLGLGFEIVTAGEADDKGESSGMILWEVVSGKNLLFEMFFWLKN